MMLPRTPSFRLDGRRSLVTGAGRGIGVALAAALAEAGASVVLAARTAAEVEAAAAAIRAAGGSATAAVLDVSDVAAVADFFDREEPFHVLVNNAGTNRPKPMQAVAPDDYDMVMDLNVRSAFFVSQACVRRMIDGGVRGALIHIGSQMGHVGGPNLSLYCAS
uniref:SDR family NAD(P)-dependent oxidoreductase n=1 Tax=Sphingomonas sp. TaxID=28214 RepID=UPI0035C7AAD4